MPLAFRLFPLVVGAMGLHYLHLPTLFRAVSLAYSSLHPYHHRPGVLLTGASSFRLWLAGVGHYFTLFIQLRPCLMPDLPSKGELREIDICLLDCYHFVPAKLSIAGVRASLGYVATYYHYPLSPGRGTFRPFLAVHLLRFDEPK